MMRRRRHGPLRAKIAICCSLLGARAASGMPLSGCSFLKPQRLSSFSSCAEFSAVRGRSGCRKVKGLCPACVTYAGDDVAMWLPDYFIEITPHTGKSLFTESPDGAGLAAQLQLGARWWESATKAPLTPASMGSVSPSAASSFWQARILTIPYGAQVTSFPPLAASKGTGLPVCYAALSEFLAAQWNYNLADGPYALAWAPVGAGLCLNIAGAGVAGGLAEAKRVLTPLRGASSSASLPVDLTCASPVPAEEAIAKNALPAADTMSPLTDPQKLCMGSWGNLIPRTGWISSEDPYMAALTAAYKFQSLAADSHINPDLKRRSDDKWQIVYPPRANSRCFHPGSPVDALAVAGDDPVSRSRDEMTTGSVRKGVYVIAVWRRRHTCEEPLEAVGGWTTTYRANLAKNEALCAAVPSL